MEESQGSREREFPSNKFGLGSQDLYEAAAYFYYSVDPTQFRDHLMHPVTEKMLEALEVYKPPIQSSIGMSAEEFRLRRQERKEQRKHSAEKLVMFIDDHDSFRKFLAELALEPEAPEYELVKFLAQFQEFDRVWQLKRILPIHKFKMS